MPETPRNALTELLKEALALSQKNALRLDALTERLQGLESDQHRRWQDLESWQHRLEDRQGALSTAQMQARGQMDVAQMQAGTQLTMGKLMAVVTMMSALTGLLGALVALWLKH